MCVNRVDAVRDADVKRIRFLGFVIELTCEEYVAVVPSDEKFIPGIAVWKRTE